MSSHYESKDKDDEDDRDLNETIEYETADSTFDYEMVKVTEPSSRRCAQKTRTGLNLWLACRFGVCSSVDSFVCSLKHQTGTKPIDRALAQAGLKKEHIDESLLVGGSTRMPRIHSELKDATLRTVRKLD